jgi:ubiquinone biosynthesis protein
LIAKSKRYREVLSLIARFGFGTYIASPWLRKLGLQKQSKSDDRLQRWRKFRQLLETLGPTYIKFGQILSNRPGIVPDELLEELALLQDRVPPFPTADAIALIENESKKSMPELFARFGDAPVASASIAQVYEANLHDGTRVAVKVRRPEIEQIIRADVAIMKDLARLMQRHSELASLQPMDLVEAFERTILEELDFEREQNNIKRLGSLFEKDETVVVPHVYNSLSGPSFITMSYIEGIKISQRKNLNSNGYDLSLVAKRGFDAYFKQIFEWGFFHADPHPGNLLVLPGNRIGILDFGMTGQLSQADRNALVEFVIALGRDDVERIVETIEMLQGCAVEDRKTLERELSDFIAEFGGTAVKDIDLNQALDKGRRIAFKHRLKLNPDLYLLFRTISLLEGIGISLDPQFRSLDAIKPYAFKLLLKQLDPRNLIQNKEIISWLADATQLIKHGPGDLRKIMGKLRDDRLVLRTESQATDRLREQIRDTGKLISMTLGFGLLFFIGFYTIDSKLKPIVGDLNIVSLAAFSLGSILLLKLLRTWMKGPR